MMQYIELATGTLDLRIQATAFPLSNLCNFAARNNRKRGFLFVSKVLGKHWPTTPTQMQQIHHYLAQSLTLTTTPCLFIALAETATGLGQGVFEATLAQQDDALFLHSTRYRVPGRQSIVFHEEHCHAPEQLLYEPLHPPHRHIFQNARELVLIDDEISTGTTLCHLVNAYRKYNPHLERIHFVTITDFSGENSSELFSTRVGLPVQIHAVLSGDFSFTPTPNWTAEPAPPAVGNNQCNSEQLVESFGRFGIDHRIGIPAADLVNLSTGLDCGARILVLGTGEFMHLAFCLGLALEACGFTVVVQATTRSPILIGAAIQKQLIFLDNYGEGIYNYLYNVDSRDFTRIIICHETPASTLDELVQLLGSHCVTYRPCF